MMAISIVSTLEEHGEIDQDHLAMSFAWNYIRLADMDRLCMGC